MILIDHLTGALLSSWLALTDYLTFHVLLCLIPAFFIAGAMTTFIPTDVILKYIGPDARAKIAYPAAALGGLLLAVCSCTVIPLFVGIYKKGAGLGPAITFLFSAPAVNILALVYTGTMIGMDIAIARAILALGFAILIGGLMALSFPEQSRTENEQDPPIGRGEEPPVSPGQSTLQRVAIAVVILSGVILVVIQNQFLLLLLFFVALLNLVYLSSTFDQSKITLFLWLVFSLFVGTSQIKLATSPLTMGILTLSAELQNMVLKTGLILVLMVPFLFFLNRKISSTELDDWLLETWIFFKSIFPLILAGVILAGFLRYFIPQDLIMTLVGSNTLVANMIAVLFGVFMYFPTLMEVPIARMFLELGMAKGPLLAYLLADPELSIQSILVTRKYLGDRKNLVYIIYVGIFTTVAGFIFGIYLGEGMGWI